MIDVNLKRQNGTESIYLGHTKVTYCADVNLQKVVSCPSEFQRLCEFYGHWYGSTSGNPSTSGSETQNSANVGKLIF